MVVINEGIPTIDVMQAQAEQTMYPSPQTFGAYQYTYRSTI